MRAIDADKLIDDLYELKYTKESPSIILTPAGQAIYNSGVESTIGTILGAPTIDAVPVVRCKDCVCRTMWNDKLICSRISGVMDGYYHGGIDVVKPDDYCSYGKRQTAKPLDAKMNGA